MQNHFLDWLMPHWLPWWTILREFARSTQALVIHFNALQHTSSTGTTQKREKKRCRRDLDFRLQTIFYSKNDFSTQHAEVICDVNFLNFRIQWKKIDNFHKATSLVSERDENNEQKKIHHNNNYEQESLNVPDFLQRGPSFSRVSIFFLPLIS